MFFLHVDEAPVRLHVLSHAGISVGNCVGRYPVRQRHRLVHSTGSDTLCLPLVYLDRC